MKIRTTKFAIHILPSDVDDGLLPVLNVLEDKVPHPYSSSLPAQTYHLMCETCQRDVLRRFQQRMNILDEPSEISQTVDDYLAGGKDFNVSARFAKDIASCLFFLLCLSYQGDAFLESSIFTPFLGLPVMAELLGKFNCTQTLR